MLKDQMTDFNPSAGQGLGENDGDSGGDDVERDQTTDFDPSAGQGLAILSWDAHSLVHCTCLFSFFYLVERKVDLCLCFTKCYYGMMVGDRCMDIK